MIARLKPLHSEVIIITGATSGIGLTTARAAARKGWAAPCLPRGSSAPGRPPGAAK